MAALPTVSRCSYRFPWGDTSTFRFLVYFTQVLWNVAINRDNLGEFYTAWHLVLISRCYWTRASTNYYHLNKPCSYMCDPQSQTTTWWRPEGRGSKAWEGGECWMEIGTSAIVSTTKIKKKWGKKETVLISKKSGGLLFWFAITVRISTACGPPEPSHASDWKLKRTYCFHLFPRYFFHIIVLSYCLYSHPGGYS